VRVRGGRIEGDPHNATAQLLAGWLASRCGCQIQLTESTRSVGPSGVHSVVLELDQNEEVRIVADRRGAVISQPNRPEATVAVPDRVLGDLLSEELRRLDPDEPYSDALQAATGVTGLSERPAVREYVWYDPAEPEQSGPPKREPVDARAGDKAAQSTSGPDKAQAKGGKEKATPAKASSARTARDKAAQDTTPAEPAPRGRGSSRS
jgi:hypothetical protein